MSNIGTPITSGSIPAVGASGTTYASQLNLFLTEVKNRLEAAVPKSALDAGELDMDGEAVANVSYLGLTDIDELPSTPNNSLQCWDGELYWVSAGGVVKLTDSGELNAAGLGGITGDYGDPNPAQFKFVDADQEYYAYDDHGAGTWAYLGALGIDLFKNTTSTTHIRVKAPSTLASTYTLTWPAALPPSTELMTLSTTGTIAGNPTTASKTITLFAPTFTLQQGATNSFTNGRVNLDANGANAPYTYARLELPIGAIITRVKARVNKASDNGTTLAVSVFKFTDGALASIGVSGTLGTNAPGLSTIDSGAVSVATISGVSYAVIMEGNDATPSATDYFYHAEVTYTSSII